MLPNRSALRLLLWNGVQDNIPVARLYWDGKSLYWNSPVTLSGAAAAAVEGLSGEGGIPLEGLQATRWANTEARRRNICYLDAELTLNEADLAKFDFKKKVHINGMNYLPLRISNSFPIRAATKALLVQV